IPHFISLDLDHNHLWPRISQLSNSTLRIFYLKKDINLNHLHLEFKDFDTLSKTVIKTQNVFTLPADQMRESLQLVQNQTGDVYLSYLSKEYCSDNACDLFKPVVRSSQNNF